MTLASPFMARLLVRAMAGLYPVHEKRDGTRIECIREQESVAIEGTGRGPRAVSGGLLHHCEGQLANGSGRVEHAARHFPGTAGVGANAGSSREMASSMLDAARAVRELPFAVMQQAA